jgi:hypothetical protein
MGKIGKTLALFLTLIIVTSCLTLLTVKPANAQTIPKPSVPEFTVKFVPNYNTIITTDPYTGTNTTTIQNLSTIQVSINSQQYTYTNGSSFYQYYSIRFKGHFEQSWTEPYAPDYTYTSFDAWQKVQGLNTSYTGATMMYYLQIFPDTQFVYNNNIQLPQYSPIPQSTTKDTTVTLSATDYPSSGQIDFQVRAMVGHNSTYYQPNGHIFLPGEEFPAIALDASSDWTNTQTVTIPASSSSPTSSPTVPEVSWLVIVLLLLSVFAVAVVLRHRKTFEQSS